jgi:diguanylate cyclase (GGDEF)-like protein
MSIRVKLILSFMLIFFLGATLGGIALWSNQQLIKQLSLKENHIRTTINALVKANSLSKAAESKLFLYLTFGKASDGGEFFSLVSSIDKQLSLLETSALDKKKTAIVDELKDQILEFTRKSKALAIQFKQEQYPPGGLPLIKHHEQIFQIHELIQELQKKSLAIVSRLAKTIDSQTVNSAAANISHHSEEAKLHLILYFMIDDTNSKDLYLTNIESIKENINILQQHNLNQGIQNTLEKVSTKYLELQQMGEQLLKLYDQKQYPTLDLYQPSLDAFNQTASWLNKAGIELEKATADKANEPRLNTITQVQTSNFTVFSLVGAAFLISILLSSWLALSLSRSISHLQAAAKEIGKGNLDVVVDLPGEDSMGDLANTFNQMTNDLQHAYQDLNSQNIALNEEITSRKHIEKELHQQATTDPLTGILNRRAFFEKANQEVARSQRYLKTLSILMLDIDHFKLINDNFGHHNGDKVLRRFAQEAKKPLRTNDYISRVGGEEFAITLPETDLASAKKIAERVRQIVQELKIPIDQQLIDLTVSIGVAEYDPEETDIHPTLQRADQALYRAKEAGRNRVFLEESRSTVS